MRASGSRILAVTFAMTALLTVATPSYAQATAATAATAPVATAAAASAPPDDVLAGVKVVATPTKSFLPKYEPEIFVGVGYSGTFSSDAHQWPTFVGSAEGLFARPGNFDIGAYSELRLGRPDEQFGRFEVGFGLEVMWRFYVTAVADVAAVLRNTYLIDTSDPNRALFRPGLGAQLSLVRSLAIQLTYDQLYSPSQDFSNGHGLLHGLSVTLKVGLCPMGEFCHQMPEHSVEKLDRSPVTCHAAALVCKTAKAAAVGTDAQLCAASARAMDTTHWPADWNDPVGAFLRALRSESAPIFSAVSAPFTQLELAHAASMKGLDDYAARQRTLGDSQMLSENYGYLVTPVMVRDWLGCDASGRAIACATDAICSTDTGVSP
ncbi:MAG TPA: hypothetical protein VH062_37735 [Polyangiaceae bacterium]|jgi:hypothetical protein|nr:hypothetical protein [Polyangiaceae bacterium]